MARSFTVNTDYLQTGSGWMPVTGSLSFWFKPTWSSGDSADHVMANYESTDFFRVEKFSDNNCYIGWNIGGVDDRVVFADTGIFSSGVWTLIVVTWVSSGNTTVYIGSTTARGTHVTPANPSIPSSMFIGARASIGTANGAIADFAAWNVVLTTGEIGALLSGVRPNRLRPQPLRFWPIDGLSSPEPDYSGNKDSATLFGTPAAANGPPITLLTPKNAGALLIGTATGRTISAADTIANFTDAAAFTNTDHIAAAETIGALASSAAFTNASHLASAAALATLSSAAILRNGSAPLVIPHDDYEPWYRRRNNYTSRLDAMRREIGVIPKEAQRAVAKAATVILAKPQAARTEAKAFDLVKHYEAAFKRALRDILGRLRAEDIEATWKEQVRRSLVERAEEEELILIAQWLL